ncbi:Hypothetical predicted protein [Cloeon dipterum]|uniref:C-type lectin domain-containing protein n=1 Tax=Cloeon dipterum TaxID=197152 RepID=A0A8S1DHN3_9INSE|nr:Hypothetical predicted protein [Cloeon dipterum]
MLTSQSRMFLLSLLCLYSAVNGAYYIIDGTSYYLEENIKVPWDEALSDCQNRSMTLVSFETRREFEKVVQFLYYSVHDLLWIWTGGHRTANTSSWNWDAGSSITEFHWAEFQPNLPQDEDACINFCGLYKAWDDDECLLQLSYMCEEVHENEVPVI